jgi:hypothetical protein
MQKFLMLAAACAALGAGMAHAGNGPRDVYFDGARTPDPYTDGAKAARFDVYTDGASTLGKRDVFTDGGRVVDKRDTFTDGA